MDQGLTLRPITAEDSEFLYRVYASTREEELRPVPWDAAQKEQFLRWQFTLQAQYYEENYPGAEFSVIVAEGEPAGRLYVHRRAEEIRIMDIALLPAFRNRGIGSALLHELLAEGRAKGLPVTIHVECNNPALRLYERLGFRRIGEHGVYYLMEWRPHAVG